MGPRRAVLGFCLALVAAPLLTLVTLQRDAPLLLNLGPGDEPFARGLRGGWERDGLLQEGATMFRWSLDGSRLEFPLVVSGDHLRARLRLARFVDTPVDVVLEVNGREVDRWRQHAGGWTLREASLGRARGPLQIQLRSEEPEGGEDLGIALDWVEVRGVDRSAPRTELLPGLAFLFLGVPLLIATLHSRRLGLGASAALGMIGPAVVSVDKLGGLVALSRSGLPLVLAISLLKLAAIGVGVLARRRDAGSTSSSLPLIFAGLAILALHQPFYYYPDVTSHTHALASIREKPRLTLDPELQKERGLHTREVAGRTVVFPYSAGFHLLATPLAGVLEETSALKTLAVVAAGASSLCVFALSRGLGSTAASARVAQALFLTLPAVTWRLTLALYPTLLAQLLELVLLLFLSVRWGRLATPRAGLALLLLVALPQLSYTGSLASVAITVLVWVGLALAKGERREPLALAAAWVASAVALLATQYRGLVTLGLELSSQLRGGSSPAEGVGPMLLRLSTFYDHAYLLLVPMGFLVARPERRDARRLIAAPVIAAAMLLSLRYLSPAIGRDLKDVELAAGAAMAAAAAAIGWLGTRGAGGRLVGGGLLAWCLGWGLHQAVHGYLGDRARAAVVQAIGQFVRLHAPIQRRRDDAGELAGPMQPRRLPAIGQDSREPVARRQAQFLQPGAEP